MSIAVPRRILPVIVLSQFAGTSLWFAVNAVMPDLQLAWGLPAAAVGMLTSAVQLGFVAGTLVFALLMLADRFRPQRVFLVCSLLGAALNAAMVLAEGQLGLLVALRFGVGFLLAGIYPVGMKIAASWYRERLGAVMGVLIGALVLGTALPHGLRALAGDAGLPVAARQACRRGRSSCSASRCWRRSAGSPPPGWCRSIPSRAAALASRPRRWR